MFNHCIRRWARGTLRWRKIDRTGFDGLSAVVLLTTAY